VLDLSDTSGAPDIRGNTGGAVRATAQRCHYATSVKERKIDGIPNRD